MTDAIITFHPGALITTDIRTNVDFRTSEARDVSMNPIINFLDQSVWVNQNLIGIDDIMKMIIGTEDNATLRENGMIRVITQGVIPVMTSATTEEGMMMKGGKIITMTNEAH